MKEKTHSTQNKTQSFTKQIEQKGTTSKMEGEGGEKTQRIYQWTSLAGYLNRERRTAKPVQVSGSRHKHKVGSNRVEASTTKSKMVEFAEERFPHHNPSR
jgi:hypothetical protein